MARTAPNLASIGRCSALVGATVLVSSVSLGWLYWLRPHLEGLPGPKVPDALALDELPDHADVALLIFLGVFGAAGLILGAVARRLGLRRLATLVVLWLGTAGWLLIASTVSLFTVRQDGFAQAFVAAGRLAAVYLGATLCALAGAIVAPGPGRSHRVASSRPLARPPRPAAPNSAAPNRARPERRQGGMGSRGR